MIYLEVASSKKPCLTAQPLEYIVISFEPSQVLCVIHPGWSLSDNRELPISDHLPL